MSGPLVLRLRGEIDIAVVDPLRGPWYLLAEQDRRQVIIIDLTEVTFMDACGLGLLVGMWNRQHGHGGEVHLRNVPGQVRTLLQLTDLSEVFPEADDPPACAERGDVIDLRDQDRRCRHV